MLRAIVGKPVKFQSASSICSIKSLRMADDNGKGLEKAKDRKGRSTGNGFQKEWKKVKRNKGRGPLRERAYPEKEKPSEIKKGFSIEENPANYQTQLRPRTKQESEL